MKSILRVFIGIFLIAMVLTITLEYINAASITLPINLQNNTTADAEEVMLNFNAIKTKINVTGMASDNITDGGIQTIDIANVAITTAKIELSNITTALINTSAVTTTKINDDAVTDDKLNADCAGEALLQDGNGALYVVPNNVTLGTGGDSIGLLANTVNEYYLNPTISGVGLSGGNGTALKFNYDNVYIILTGADTLTVADSFIRNYADDTLNGTLTATGLLLVNDLYAGFVSDSFIFNNANDVMSGTLTATGYNGNGGELTGVLKDYTDDTLSGTLSATGLLLTNHLYAGSVSDSFILNNASDDMSGTLTATGFSGDHAGDGTMLTGLLKDYESDIMSGTLTATGFSGDHAGDGTMLTGLLKDYESDVMSGTLTATGYNGNGGALNGVLKDYESDFMSGTLTATAFVGDGGNLTGITVSDSAWVDYSDTSTILGWDEISTQQIWYKQTSDMVYVTIRISGTSNSTSASFTLPIDVGTEQSHISTMITEDNSSNLTASGMVRVTGGTNTFTCFKNTDQDVLWTHNNTKAIYGNFFYRY